MKLLKKLSVLVLFSLLVTGLASCEKKKVDPVKLSGYTMGTTYNITLAKLPEKVTKEEVQKKIGLALKQVNQQMSTFKKDSELSTFNRFKANEWFPVSKELLAVIEQAVEISHKTNGAFDITVGPLVNIWGFGPDEKEEKTPSQDVINLLSKKVGYKKLEIRKDPAAIKKKVDGLYLDLSSIAKGYGVDVVANVLDSYKVQAYLVEIGGEIRTKGLKNGKDKWNIAIEKPVVNERKIEKVISITDLGMATSGDYRNYFEVDGQRFSHTIDPRKGRPISHKLASVTILDPSCMKADALATAINVLGPEEGFEFALREDIATMMIIRSGDGFIEKSTPKFEKLIKTKN